MTSVLYLLECIFYNTCLANCYYIRDDSVCKRMGTCPVVINNFCLLSHSFWPLEHTKLKVFANSSVLSLVTKYLPSGR